MPDLINYIKTSHHHVTMPTNITTQSQFNIQFYHIPNIPTNHINSLNSIIISFHYETANNGRFIMSLGLI